MRTDSYLLGRRVFVLNSKQISLLSEEKKEQNRSFTGLRAYDPAAATHHNTTIRVEISSVSYYSTRIPNQNITTTHNCVVFYVYIL